MKLGINTVTTNITKDNILIFICGCLAGTIFAPIYFIPGLFAISYLCYRVHRSTNWQESAWLGLKFGLGYYLVSIYWISFAIGVYIDDFWWAIPFALFGLPLLLSMFIIMTCIVSYKFRLHSFYPLFFSISWCFFEWVSSWFLTGFPWVLVGYSLCCYLPLIQIGSVIGVYGISLIILHVVTNLYYFFTKQYRQLLISILYGMLLVIIAIFYGNWRLSFNPTKFSSTRVRLVQPSIPQVDKWEMETLSENLYLLQELSTTSLQQDIDIIIWPESALILPMDKLGIKNFLVNMLQQGNAILITGSVVEYGKENNSDFRLYTAMQAINKHGDILFDYYKSHLVPFGEYMPFSHILAIKKLTHGFIDYTAGERKLVFLSKFNLHIKPLICYESIFPELVRYQANLADIMINITNDGWYGNSSGPYQHLQINVLRAVENGLPIIRVANNGITAIIDPLGRVINKLELNAIDFIDSYVPIKLSDTTYYTKFGEIMLLVLAVYLAIVQYFFYFTQKALDKR